MNIGFVSDSITDKMAGVGRYAKNVFSALAKKGQSPVPIDWRSPGELSAALGCPVDRMVRIANPWPVTKTLLWHAGLLRTIGSSGGLDLVFSPSQFLHPFGTLAMPFVYVVHDISFRTFPECHKRGKKTVYQAFFPRTLNKADHIVCISDYTRRELLKYYTVQENKVSVIHPGVEDRFRPVTDPASLSAVQARYCLPDRFFVYVGTIEPRKNLAALFHAIDGCKGRLSAPLLLAGKIGWRADPIQELHHQLGLSDRVRFLGYVPDEDLPALYSLATACVYVSKEEGFGLPLLEAMRCGTPVLSSDAGSLLEVSAGAALVAPSDDIAALGEGLVRISEDGVLRNQLKEKGLARAREFSWDATADGLSALFERLAGQASQKTVG